MDESDHLLRDEQVEPEGGSQKDSKSYFYRGTKEFVFPDPKQEVSPNVQFWLRLTAVLISLVCVVAISIAQMFLVDPQGHGIKDYIHIWTGGLNEHIREDDTRRNTLLTCFSLLFDGLALLSLVRFTLYATTYRVVLALCLFYSIRAITTRIFYVEYPQGYNFEFPGVYSLLISYGSTNDFFFSGPSGVLMI
jgi:hypothetical protein